MGYPTGVQSFTSKNAGDVIQPAHVNDLQTEVAAIEGALLGTVTHSINVAGNSTLAALSVSGGSTFAARPTMPPPDFAQVFAQSTMTIASSQTSTLAFVGETYVSNSSMHAGANPERLVPQSTGWYQFSAQIGLSLAGVATRRQILIQDSTGLNLADSRMANSTDALHINITGYKRYDVLGGYARVVFASDGASTYSVSTGLDVSWFSMLKL